MQQSIAFVGFMGSGKSTVAKLLAKAMDLQFVDLDLTIEEQEKQSISEIFKSHSEDYFRKIETQILQEVLSESRPRVISCGGGTILSKRNRALLSKECLVVYLEADDKLLLDRLKHAKSERPLIADKSEEELLDFIRTELNSRMKFYQQADFSIQASKAKASIQELKKKLLNYSK